MGYLRICGGGSLEWLLPLDFDGDTVIKIIDFDNIGSYYQNYLKGGYSHCKQCGVIFKKTSNRNTYCMKCNIVEKNNVKKISCTDCGKNFVVNIKSNKQVRCDVCQKEFIKQYDRQRKIK